MKPELVYMHGGAGEGQKWAANPLGLELNVVVLVTIGAGAKLGAF